VRNQRKAGPGAPGRKKAGTIIVLGVRDGGFRERDTPEVVGPGGATRSLPYRRKHDEVVMVKIDGDWGLFARGLGGEQERI